MWMDWIMPSIFLGAAVYKLARRWRL
jgi:hypothetical protein